MKLIFPICLVLFAIVNNISAQKSTVLKNQNDSLSYAYGILLGHSLDDASSEFKQLIKADIVSEALKTVLSKTAPQMTQEVAMDYFQTYMLAQMEKEAVKKRVEEDIFLAANAKNEGVITTESGLQYKIITKGAGKIPGPGSNVELHYTGTLTDGTEFDSSVERGEKVIFPVEGLISGFSEGLQLMTEGSKYIFYLPSKLAYGEQGSGQQIAPYSTLIFEVELFRILEEREDTVE
ncbi:MAG: FKBP-type peptidyl-prolyl cis-trans isomerase [Cytophagaceae bacterium]|jgi:FKBP-type peptidyl-prolyl cis-trans isomerase|nr:FKBP-type peptidyl-prolyl cis-trans isomerase [Cytophagaceae bacterium]